MPRFIIDHGSVSVSPGEVGRGWTGALHLARGGQRV